MFRATSPRRERPPSHADRESLAGRTADIEDELDAALGGVPDVLEVDTVDGFQGREKEAVVVSLVRSNLDDDVGFLDDERRFNVALTRARQKAVVVGDTDTVTDADVFEAFVAHVRGADAEVPVR